VVILFVPVRYRASGGFNGKEINARAYVTWLMNLIWLKAEYLVGEGLHIRARICGIVVYDNKRPKRNKKKSERDTKDITTEAVKEEKTFEDEKKSEDETKAASTNYQEENINFDEKSDDIQNESAPKKNFCAKIKDIIANIKFTFQNICGIITTTKDKLEYYVKLLQLDSTKRAFDTCKGQVFKVLKILSPRKYSVNLHLGFDDPAVMGEVLAVWGMLYPWHMGRIDVRPEFDEKVAEGDFLFKGHIMVFSIVKAGCIIYFNKDIKRFIGRLRHNR
jgi:hypothetical protein